MTDSNGSASWPIWATETVEIKAADPSWILKGIQEGEELLQLLLPFSVRSIEHIGSTAIPNLPAKPIVDLMGSIPTFESIPVIAKRLLDYGWHYVSPELDNQTWRRFFIKVINNSRSAHLHLILEGEKRWDEQIIFREQLKRHPLLLVQYADLKQKLAQQFSHDREAYTMAKTEFVNRVLLLADEGEIQAKD